MKKIIQYCKCFGLFVIAMIVTSIVHELGHLILSIFEGCMPFGFEIVIFKNAIGWRILYNPEPKFWVFCGGYICELLILIMLISFFNHHKITLYYLLASCFSISMAFINFLRDDLGGLDDFSVMFRLYPFFFYLTLLLTLISIVYYILKKGDSISQKRKNLYPLTAQTMI